MVIQPKPKSSIAFTCLLDLLFVLIFAALLKVDPTGIEKITVVGSAVVDDVTKEFKNTIAELQRQLEDVQLEKQDLLQQAKLADVKMDTKLKNAEAELYSTKTELRQIKKENQRLNARTANVLVTDIGGVWEGTGCQNRSGKCWSIKLPMPRLLNYPHTQSVPVISMSYPSLGCKAKWYFQENVDGALKFKERITSGRCLDKGIVTITAKVNGLLDFDYEKGGHLAFGSLSRSSI